MFRKTVKKCVLVNKLIFNVLNLHVLSSVYGSAYYSCFIISLTEFKGSE